MNKPSIFGTFPHASELPLQMQHKEEDVESQPLQEEANGISLDQVFKMNRWTKLRCSPTSLQPYHQQDNADYQLKAASYAVEYQQIFVATIFILHTGKAFRSPQSRYR